MAGELIDFIGYAPDLDTTTPGVFTDCGAIVPSDRGFRGAPSPVSQTEPALAAECKGAAAVQKRDDATRIFAGTANALYESAGSSWTTRTPTAAGQTLTGLGTEERWIFTQFQDTTLAAAKTEVPVFLSTATEFAKVTANAPKCAILETVGQFVMGFNVSDQGAIFDSADRPDGWWCAAKGGFTSWVPSITTEAATGALTSSPGKIVAGRRFGYQIVAYKRTSMYIGTYVGPPVIWDFQLIPGAIGALSQECVVNVGTPEQPRHLFMGIDNFYQFDGGRPVPIGNPIRKTVFDELAMSFYYACRALHDLRNKRVYFFYPTTNSNIPNKCVVYNYVTGRWGRDDRSVEAVLDYIAAGTVYDNVGSLYATYDAIPATAYDLLFTSAGSPHPAIFDTMHTLKTLTGVAGASSIILGDYGNDKLFTTLSRVRPRFFTAPSGANLSNSFRKVLSDSLTPDQTVALSSGRFDLMRSARWHRLNLAMTGDHEESGITVDVTQDGEE